MRSDYAFYILGTTLLIIAVIIAINFAETSLSAVAITIAGFLFFGLGYFLRPKPKTARIEAPPPAPAPALPTPSTVTEVVKEEKPEIVVEATPVPSMMELTEVKGIGEKRKEQLRALNISSVEDLAKASAEDLASKLKISPKITGRWIENAKKLLEKS